MPRSAPSASWALGGTGDSIGVRVPSHPLALAVLRAAGPLAVTSANRSGEPPARTCEELCSTFGDLISVYLCQDGPLEGDASTVVDLAHGIARIVRAGAVSAARIKDLLGAGIATVRLALSEGDALLDDLHPRRLHREHLPLADGRGAPALGPRAASRRRRAGRLVGGHDGLGGIPGEPGRRGGGSGARSRHREPRRSPALDADGRGSRSAALHGRRTPRHRGARDTARSRLARSR